MAKTLTLARKPAPTMSPADTIPPNVQEHIQAARLSLEKALQVLSSDACTAAKIQIATGRAIRSATLLKRVCKALDVNTASKGA